MYKRLFLFVCLAGLATPSLSAAATVSLVPSRDNTLIQSATGHLSNGQGDVFFGRTNQDGQGPATISIRRGLMYFDVVGAVPANSKITAVTLTVRDVQGLNGDRSIELHRALADWGEGASFFAGGQGAPAENNDATWLHSFYNKANPAASTFWSTPGGDYDPTISGATIISDDLGGGQLFTWDSATNPLMVADLQSWLDSPATNFGWLIKGVETAGQTAKRVNSREATTLPNLPPSLVITYEPIPEPGTLVLVGMAVMSIMIAHRSRQLRSRGERDGFANAAS